MNYGLRIATLSCLMAVSFASLAAPRGEKEARELASKFLSAQQVGKYGAKGTSATMSQLTLAGTASSVLGTASKTKGASCQEALYIYNLGDEAFAIVSGEDTCEPILAYSYTNAFATENVPEHIKRWLQTYVDEQNYYVAHPENFKQTISKASSSQYPEHVSPIMNYQGAPIQWGQDEPFNNDCPNYMGYRSAAGCVATALAQIMYYHRWPEKGQGGSKNYFTDTYRIAQDFDYSEATFDYSKMLPHYYSGRYTEEQGAEAAKLTHAIGVAVDMDYSPEGSGTSSMRVGNPVIKYFNYDKNIHYVLRDFFSLEEWTDMIKKEISEGRPICYAGFSTSIGHQFVFDGYAANNMVHINWGWSGVSDGYYRLSALAPNVVGIGGGSATSGGFVFYQGMWLGMQRPDASTVPSSFYIIEDSNITIDKMAAMTGEKITMTCANYYNSSVDFDGEIGMVMMNANDEAIVLARKDEHRVSGFGIAPQDGSPALSLEGTIPTDLADGNYTLMFATKQKDEPTWKRMRTGFGYNDRFIVNVKDGKLTMTQGVIEPEAKGTLASDHAIYTRCRSQFTAKLTNTATSEFFGIATVGIIDVKDGEQKLIALCGENQVTLPVGEETEVVFKASIEAYKDNTVSAGSYKACVLLEHQGKYYQVGDMIDIDIKRIPSGMASLVADEFSAEKKEVALDESLCGTITVHNTRSVYSGNIGIIVFKKGDSSGSLGWEKEVFLENGSSATINYDMAMQWPAGTYKADLRFGESYTNSITNFEFTIKDEFSGIKTVTNDTEGQQSPTYNLAGQRVKSDHRGIIIKNGRKLQSPLSR